MSRCPGVEIDAAAAKLGLEGTPLTGSPTSREPAEATGGAGEHAGDLVSVQK